jgi:thiol-disulfide isomerase/thioredoxin
MQKNLQPQSGVNGAVSLAHTASPPFHHRRFAALAGFAAALAMAAAVAILLTRGWGSSPGAAVTSANDFVLPRLDASGTLSPTAFRGRPLLVTLFSSDCGACSGELPLLAGAAQELGGRAAFVGVDSGDDGAGLGTARSDGIGSWPLARDIGGSAGTDLRQALGGGPVNQPLTAFYDVQGHLLEVERGPLSAAQLGTALYRLYGLRLRL